MNKVLILDTETGGLNPKDYSLLTIGMIAVDIENAKVLGKEYIEIKHDIYHVHPKALEVNKLDLVKHHNGKNALSPKDAVGKFVDFVKKHFKDDEMPAPPAGHNYPFDESFLKELFRQAGANYEKFVSYQSIDTLALLRMLAALDIIPGSACRLDGARKHFGIMSKRGGQAHNALTDCEDTLTLLSKLSELLLKDNPTSEETEEEEEVKEDKSPPAKSTKKTAVVEDDEDEDEEEEDEEPETKPAKSKSEKKVVAKEEVEEDEDEDEEDEDDDETEEEVKTPPAKSSKKAPPPELKDEDEDDEEEEDDTEDDDLDDWDDEDEDDED